MITLPLGRARRRGHRRGAAAPRAVSARRVLGWAAAGVLSALAIWGGVRAWEALSNPHRFPVRQVQVGGNFRYLDPARLKSALAGVVGGSFFAVDVRAVRAAALALPWVQSAAVRREWPGTLVVRVVERVPYARWGADALVTAAGTVFRPRRIPPLPALPELHGPAGTEALVLRRYREYGALLAAAGLRLVRVDLDARRSWSLGLAGGVRLHLGRADPTQRLKRFLSVYPAAFAGRVGDIAVVDLRYTNGFAVRWKRPAADRKRG